MHTKGKPCQCALCRKERIERVAPELLALLEDYFKVFKDGKYFKPDDEFLKETQETIRRAKGE